MKKLISLFVLSLIVLVGCQQQQITTLSTTSIQGKWNDNKANHFDLGGIEYYYEFTGNEFRLKVVEYSDLLLSNCNAINDWKNYIKGTFSIVQQSIVFNGVYCDSTYTVLTISPCLEVQPIGGFIDTLAVNMINDHTLSFSNKFGTTTILNKQ
jgi:hypothetical protein